MAATTGYRTIPLTQGFVCVVDAADYDAVASFRWLALRCRRGVYAVRWVRSGKRRVAVRMHRMLLDAPPGMEVDHQDGNTLNNCRDNLRLCSFAQNRANRRKHAKSSSRYKGVSWNKKRQKWMAYIKINNRSTHLGMFVDEAEAAHAYDRAASAQWGEFASLNFGENP